MGGYESRDQMIRYAGVTPRAAIIGKAARESDYSVLRRRGKRTVGSGPVSYSGEWNIDKIGKLWQFIWAEEMAREEERALLCKRRN